MTRYDLITNGYIIRTLYRGRRKTKVAVYEIHDYILGEHLRVYLMHYGQLLSVAPEYETGD